MKPFLSSHKRISLVAVIIISLCILPLQGMGMHIHLADVHMGDELHAHHAETHGFHLHTSQHDNIDTDIEHASDTQALDIEIDSRLFKQVKITAFLLLLSLMVIGRIIMTLRVKQQFYRLPVQFRFEVFRSLLRGPPVVCP